MALYLWPAFHAPVVIWADSRIDLDWASRGIGIFSAVPPIEQQAAGVHQAKPLYLLYLRSVIALAPRGHETRAIVVVQSLLLCLAILWASFGGGRSGAATGVLLLLCLRLRDSASAVMSEALTGSLLLVVTGGILRAPETWLGAGALGAAVGALFWVRPNAGAIALALVVARYFFTRRYAPGLRASAAFLVVVIPIALATRPGPGSPELRGFAFPLLVGSTDYCWEPAVTAVQATGLESRQREQIRTTRENWRALWTSLQRGDPDARRQLGWRAFRGLLGAEYYDARWSTLYLEVDNLSRLLTPILLLAALSLFLTLPFKDRSINGVALLLVAALVAQNLVLGSLPRYDLPFLPVLLVLAVQAAIEAWRNRRRAGAAACILLVLIALGLRFPYVFDSEWGRVESAGITLRQVIPRGALPKKDPATLHVRIGPVDVPSAAELDVFASGDRRIYSSAGNASRQRPDLSIPLPGWLLEENQHDHTEIRLVSSGGYGPDSYVRFPVIPPPWGRGAHREGNAFLSPYTGIRWGALDWWAHEGTDPDARLSANR